MSSLLNIEFVWWWMFLLLPLPLLVLRLAPAAKPTDTLTLPFLPSNTKGKAPSTRLPKVLASL